MSFMYVIGFDGNQLNSKCIIAELDGLNGLILESWGQKKNPHYNEALKVIIHRIKSIGIQKINVFLASKPVMKNFPDSNSRKLYNSKDGFFHLEGQQAENLRLDLCRKQKFFSSTEIKTQARGNGSKRIFLHTDEIKSSNEWRKIALGDLSLNFGSTTDVDELSKRVGNIFEMELLKPEGVSNPHKLTTQAIVYSRSPDVVAYIIKLSDGNCEACEKPAPFKNKYGVPYLEVHHVIPLSKGGADTPENCVALCPNCHRAIHFSENNKKITASLYQKTSRLSR